MTAKKKIPKFASEDEEREFWAHADTTEYFDMSQARRVSFPNLKPTFKKKVSVSLHEAVLEEIEMLAELQGVPVDTLIEKYLSEKILEERDIIESDTPE